MKSAHVMTILALAIAAMLASSPAKAAELVVLSVTALKSAVADLSAVYEAATGDTIHFIFGTTAEIRDRVISGENADVVIVPPTQMESLVKAGMVVRTSRQDISAVRFGMAVRTGAPAPSVSDEASFKAALLVAPSIAMADPGSGAPSGIYLTKLMERLGLTEMVKPKLQLFQDGQAAMQAVARGRAALGLGLVSEIVPVAGVTMAGPLPEMLQLRTVFTGALVTWSQEPAKGATLLAFLRRLSANDALKRNGFDAVP